jgi:hypothetical protein
MFAAIIALGILATLGGALASPRVLATAALAVLGVLAVGALTLAVSGATRRERPRRGRGARRGPATDANRTAA